MPAADCLATWRRAGRTVVHELDTKAVLEAAGIAVPRRDPAVGKAVLKIASDLHPHKTEHGLVRLGVDASQVEAVAVELAAHIPSGALLVEEMITDGVAEWIVGCRHDATFGPVVVIGTGGILVELLDEATVRLAPTSIATARRAIETRRGACILAGIRGKPAGDVDALAELVVSLSAFFAEHADAVAEIEINPVIVRPVGFGAIAADALMTLTPSHQQEN